MSIEGNVGISVNTGVSLRLQIFQFIYDDNDG